MQAEDKRIEEIFRAIQEVASGNFSARINISEKLDELDGISTGINMLAEEIELRIEKFAEEKEIQKKTIEQLQELKLELSKSEELFWQVFQTSPDGICITRMSDGIFVEVNKSFEKMTGYTRKELIGHSVFDFNMWVNMGDREKMTRQLKNKGFYTNMESDFMVKTGTLQRGLISVSIMNINEEPHMITVSRNITRIRQAEQELKVSQKKYRELIQLAPDGIILIDVSGRIEMANPAFLRITRLKAGEVKGVRLHEIKGIDEEYIAACEHVIGKILRGESARTLEIRFTTRSANKRHLEIQAKPLKQEGRVTGIQAVVRDITDRIRAMELLKASEIQYRTSMDSMHDPIYLIDSEMKILMANEALRRTLKDLGFPVNVVGKHFTEAFPFLPVSTVEDYRKTFRDGKTRQKEENYQIADHQYHSDTRLIPIVENRKITSILTIVQDVTERKKAENVQQIMYNISNAVNLSTNLNDLFLTIQDELGKIFDTRNFFIAFYNKEDDTLSLPFFVDEKDAFDAFPAKRTLTGYMIRNDRPILMKDRDIDKLVRSGEIEDVGTPSKIWLGVPLKLKEEIIGALVVQNYEDELAYTEKDLEILQFVSSQISLSIQTRRAYDEMELERAYFEQLFEGSPETVVLTKNDGTLIRVNNEFEKLFGYSAEEALGKKIDELIVPGELNAEARQISTRVANGGKILLETLRQHKNGSLIHVSVLGTPIEIEGGQVAVYGIYRDITDRKNAEIALRESEEKLRNILYSSPDAIMVSDLKGYVTECNQAALDIFECDSTAQLIGLNANQFVIPELKSKGISTLKTVLRNGYVKNIEFEVVTLKGNHIFVDLSASIIRDTNDRPIGIATITQDITERKSHERDLEEAKEKAEESDRLKSAFLANMSHEIRTPMNAILGFSELLKTEGLSKELRDEYIKIISSKGNELMLIINDIIDISKIEAGDIKIEKADVEISRFIRELHREFSEEKNLMNKEEIQFRLKIPEEDNPVVHTDSSRLKQILNNLVSNAFKFTQEGYVELGFFSDGWKVVFYVRDTGIGIAEAKKDIIFDRFRQVDESINSEFGGTGLGLAISRHLTTLLGGEIWMESVLNHGSTFSFYLPRLGNSEEHGAGPGSGRETGTAPGREMPDLSIDLSGKKIVIAEDDSANYLYIESFLKRSNSDVIWAKDGNQLIEIFRSEPSLDMILMDIRMPALNGLEATRIIRRTNETIPVIALTAYAFADDREKSLEAGCNDFLAKPVKIEELSKTIARYLK